MGEEGSQDRLGCPEVYTSVWATEVRSTLKEWGKLKTCLALGFCIFNAHQQLQPCCKVHCPMLCWYRAGYMLLDWVLCFALMSCSSQITRRRAFRGTEYPQAPLCQELSSSPSLRSGEPRERQKTSHPNSQARRDGEINSTAALH